MTQTYSPGFALMELLKALGWSEMNLFHDEHIVVLDLIQGKPEG